MKQVGNRVFDGKQTSLCIRSAMSWKAVPAGLEMPNKSQKSYV